MHRSEDEFLVFRKWNNNRKKTKSFFRYRKWLLLTWEISISFSIFLGVQVFTRESRKRRPLHWQADTGKKNVDCVFSLTDRYSFFNTFRTVWFILWSYYTNIQATWFVGGSSWLIQCTIRLVVGSSYRNNEHMKVLDIIHRRQPCCDRSTV